MKNILSILISLLVTHTALGQDSTKVINKAETKKVDNYTVQYLMIFNSKKEMLMMKNAYGWHPLVIRSNEPQAIKEAMDSLSETGGISIKDLKLSGLYVHKFEGLTDHPEISFRSYYTAQLNEGALKQPTDTSKTYHWIAIKDVVTKTTLDFVKLQITPILENPQKVWGGTYLIQWKDDKFVGTKVLEPPYLLN